MFDTRRIFLLVQKVDAYFVVVASVKPFIPLVCVFYAKSKISSFVCNDIKFFERSGLDDQLKPNQLRDNQKNSKDNAQLKKNRLTFYCRILSLFISVQFAG